MEGIAIHNRRLALPNNRHLEFERPLVMGVINATPDSFSDGGQFLDTDKALEQARKMIDDGADMIDIGGESSRPGSEPVSADAEIARVIPVIERLRQLSGIPISIDTSKAAVAEKAISVGVDIINDISALRNDPDMVEVVAENKVPVVLMHMLGEPKTMQVNPNYSNCINEIKQFFSERIHYCHNYGIDRSQIILDPGIGFGKRLEDNMTIFKNLDEFASFDCPVMVGASRKSFIQMITHKQDKPTNRIGGSLSTVLWAVEKNVNIVRIHDVAETVEAIAVMQAIKDSH